MSEKTIWELLQEPLEGTINIRTNAGPRPLKLVCPTREQLEQLQKDLPEPKVPTKEVDAPVAVGAKPAKGAKVVKVTELDDQNTEYLKALEDRELSFGLRLIDLGMKDKPAGDLDARLAIYKRFANPILQQIVLSVNYLMNHELPPVGEVE